MPVKRIQSTQGQFRIGLGEIWQYRELLFFLIWRDVSIRYKQTVLGASWAIIQPLFTMVVFSLIFGGIAQMPSDGIPYPLFSFAALVPWTLFAGGFSRASESLVGNSALLTKVYFPRLIIPFASVVSGLVDFAVAFVILLGMLLFFGRFPTQNILWLPFFILLALATAIALSLWLSALYVRYRDIRYLIPFIAQLWLYATPIVYPSSMVKNPILHTVLGINPMAGVIEGFRWALLGLDSPPGGLVIISSLTVILLLFGGLIYFKRFERTFADLI